MTRSEEADLSKLAIRFMTDKEGDHHYTKHYHHHFQSLRHRRLNILEVGIGGYENPADGGASLRMWKEYFPNSRIFGIDIYDKSQHDQDRIKTFKGSQVDEEFLTRVAREIGTIDIIVDDGSHIIEHVITTFKILFPLMSPDGIYVVEDLQTSYWEHVVGQNWGGSKSLIASHTSMNFFKSLSDGLNYEEFTLDEYVPSYFDKHIISMHFYHNLVFIYKGQNNEESNVLGKQDVATLIRHQNENHDGTGYPDRLTESRIPIGSRILRAINEAGNLMEIHRGRPELVSERLMDSIGTRLDPKIGLLVEEYLRVVADPSWNEGKRRVALEELQEGMVIAGDLITGRGTMLLSKDSALTHSQIERLSSLSHFDPIIQEIYVYDSAA